MVEDKKIYTLFGIIAILLWATGSAASIRIIDSLGPLNTISILSGVAGISLLIFEMIISKNKYSVFHIEKRFAVIGGTLFILYNVFFFWSLYICPTKEISSQVNIINYLWPFFLIIFSIPILKLKPKYLMLTFGILIGIIGIFITMCKFNSINLSFGSSYQFLLPFILMIFAAMSWGLYSVIVKKFYTPNQSNATPIFFLALFFASLIAKIFIKESISWDTSLIFLILYDALLPFAAAYLLWEVSSKKGDVIVIGSFSYFLPFMSTVAICIYLHTPMYLNLLIGVFFTIIGAIVTQKSVSSIKK